MILISNSSTLNRQLKKPLLLLSYPSTPPSLESTRLYQYTLWSFQTTHRRTCIQDYSSAVIICFCCYQLKSLLLASSLGIEI